MTEQQFTNELLKWAKAYKWRTFHVRNSGYAGNTYVQGDRGFPDLVLLRPPRLVVAELKVGKAGTLKGEPTSDQAVWLDALAEVGVTEFPIETYVWRPDMWSEILVVLSKP